MMRVPSSALPAVLASVAQTSVDAGADASRRLSAVIVALVVLAVLITVATVVFWRLSTPGRPSAGSVPRGVPGGSTNAS